MFLNVAKPDMKLLFFGVCFCFSFILITPAMAQQSIGFSDSTDFQYLIDYRLPDWGYSNFSLSTASIGNNGQLDVSKLDRDPEATELPFVYEDRELRNRLNISLQPAYEYYRESEQRIIDLYTFTSVGSGYTSNNRKINPDQEFAPQDTKVNASYSTRSNNIGQYIQFDSKFYVVKDLFVLAGFLGDVSFSGSRYKADHTFNPQNDREVQERNRYLRADPELGIGFGRVRNVGPQIRAIRLNERYSTITNSSLTNEEIIASAEQFTKVQGYSRTNDRFRKYFWGDMNQILSGKIDAVSAYDIFYLDDVFGENIGQRLEGFDVLLSSKFAYYNRLNRDEETTTIGDEVRRDLLIRKRVDAYSQIRWYKNLNLNHQLGFISQHQVAFPLEKDDELEIDIDVVARFSWLWTITDRYLLETSLNNQYEKPVFKDRLFNVDRYQYQTNVRSALTYFIENKLALTGRVLLGFEKQGNDNSNNGLKTTTNFFRWQASVSLRYYFNRNLF